MVWVPLGSRVGGFSGLGEGSGHWVLGGAGGSGHIVGKPPGQRVFGVWVEGSEHLFGISEIGVGVRAKFKGFSGLWLSGDFFGGFEEFWVCLKDYLY